MILPLPDRGFNKVVIARLVFKENTDRQIVFGMVSIVAGDILLWWEPGGATFSTGALFILGACLCWVIDNNLTRKVSTNDAMLVDGLKGLVAGRLQHWLGAGRRGELC